MTSRIVLAALPVLLAAALLACGGGTEAEKRYRIGVEHMEAGRYVEAVSEFGNAINLDATMALAYNGRGEAYWELGSADGALQHYEAAIRIDPELAVAYHNRAEVIRSLGLEESIWLNKIEEEWMKLVGDVVAKHARPGRYDAGHLIVFVDSSVWLNELQRYGRTEILSKVQQRFGPEKITGIRLQLDPDGTCQ